MGKSIKLSHLLFLYVVILFGQGSIKEVVKYKEILELYSKSIGVEVNVYILFVLFNGIVEEIERQCKK